MAIIHPSLNMNKMLPFWSINHVVFTLIFAVIFLQLSYSTLLCRIACSCSGL